MPTLNFLELLSPAKNLEFGKAAINHGADAIYIGAPQFGARINASNSIQDIEELVKYAHLYKSKVFVAFNTLLFDKELEDARKVIMNLYNAGIDALIIQDMGLLEMDLPPVALHASTQCHNASVEKVLFLEKVGFQRVILARELSIEEIQQIRLQTKVELESFVHGALCVSYSGQCYMSHAIANRSGNRGICSQPCRSSYDLLNEEGTLLKENLHLLSLKDFNASNQIEDLIAAGVCSFKIEGRLKDIDYLKNITANYRFLLDHYLENDKRYIKASSGKTIFHFTPDIEKTFNRTYTSYFLNGRSEKVAMLNTQKSIGKRVGEVKDVFENGDFLLKEKHTLQNGDGLCFFTKESSLDGFFVNKIDNEKITPNKKISIQKEDIIYRNYDLQFSKQLNKNTAERKIDIVLELNENTEGFSLKATDEDNVFVIVKLSSEKELSKNANDYVAQIRKQLSKLGNTVFSVREVTVGFEKPYFLPISFLNQLRRKAITALEEERIRLFSAKDICFTKNTVSYFLNKVDYRTNILNEKALEFYKRHGVTEFEYALEKVGVTKSSILMTTKHCIKYQLEQCPKYYTQTDAFSKPLFLRNNGKLYQLEFDCKECRMLVLMQK